MTQRINKDQPDPEFDWPQIKRDYPISKQLTDFKNYKTNCECPFPSHKNKTPSLNVSIGPEGWEVFHCFGCGAGGSIIDFVMRMKRWFSPQKAAQLLIKGPIEPVKAMTESTPQKPKPKKLTGDEDRFQIADIKGTTKRFYDYGNHISAKVGEGWTQVTKVSDSEYVYGVYGLRQPYNVQAFRSSIIYITEGEKDCETMMQLGYAATTFIGANWHTDYLPYFKDVEKAVILPANSDAGESFAHKVAEGLKGTVPQVGVVRLHKIAKDNNLSPIVDAMVS